MKKNLNFFFILFIILFQHILTKDDSFKDKGKYPNRKSIKGLQPDYQPIGQIIGNAVHTVAMNFEWYVWQPTLKKGTCAELTEASFNGYCYVINTIEIDAIKKYTDEEIMVTAVVYGVPEWARRSCSVAVNPTFCAPTEEGAVYYGLFLKFLANFFNGENGNGRISDFVIHNEVNDISWFNFGCNNGNCDLDLWTSVYAESYNKAYDNVINEQKNEKVLISFQHDFFSDLDVRLKNKNSVISCETFLKYLVPKLGNRKWRLAFHSYPIDLLKPEFGPNDYPYVTFGNIGAISGWLHKNYPKNPHAWEVQLTENGINGDSSMLAAQKEYLCKAFKNILGTPGIESFIYHRLVDHAAEGSLKCGLWSATEKYKPAWELFALANRKNVGEGYPTCGFELLPYVEIVNGYNGNVHYITTRNLPNGFKKESSFKIRRESNSEDMSLVYECRLGGPKGEHAFISSDYNCENQFNMGPMGYLYTKKVDNSIPLYRCLITKNSDHFLTTDSNCDGIGKKEALMGYGFSM